MRLRPTRITFAAVLVCAIVALVDDARGQDSPPSDKAWIQVLLPTEDAVLIIGKSPTEKKGKDRLFESPSISKDKEYSYQVTATWTVEGKEHKEVRVVHIKAGVKSVLDFTKPEERPKDKDAPPKDKDVPAKDKDKDKDVPPKDKDKDKDVPPKDKKDKDVPPKDKDKDVPPKDKDKDVPPKDKKDTPLKDKDSPPKDKDLPPKDKDIPLKDKDAPLKDKDAPAKDKDKNEKGSVRILDLKRPAHSRTFEFTYGGTISAKAGDKVRVWVPVPPTNAEQEATILTRQLPGKEEINNDPLYGNRILSFVATADESGNIPFQIGYKILRKEVLGATLKEVAESPDLLTRFLQPDKLGPLEGKHLDLLKDKKLDPEVLARARTLYDTVFDHLRYAKEGDLWGRGDVLWVCDSKFGNCTDFHSLFISLARANKVPAKFEIGFSLPPKHGEGEITGYHCWGWFRTADRGWVPVDISEASKDTTLKEYYFGNLTENRVAFSTGRDVKLVPPPANEVDPVVNFLLSPVVQDLGTGKLLDKAAIKTKFTFKDVN
jgi:uncharacterized protein (TIGR03000 family)